MIKLECTPILSIHFYKLDFFYFYMWVRNNIKRFNRELISLKGKYTFHFRFYQKCDNYGIYHIHYMYADENCNRMGVVKYDGINYTNCNDSYDHNNPNYEIGVDDPHNYIYIKDFYCDALTPNSIHIHDNLIIMTFPKKNMVYRNKNLLYTIDKEFMGYLN